MLFIRSILVLLFSFAVPLKNIKKRYSKKNKKIEKEAKKQETT
jgi:hypothetical protein